MEATTAAWLAALIDGEGSVMLIRRTTSPTAKTQRNPQYRAVVSICNTDPRLFEALQQKTGIDRVYRHRVGGDPRSPRKRAMWTWRLVAGEINRLMPDIRPWLVLKGEQADLLLEALAIKDQLTSRAGQEWDLQGVPARTARLDQIYAQIRALNTRGREVLA